MNQPNFNMELFIKNSNFSDHKSFEIVKEALKTSDEIGSTLRTHLFFERVLESWIYAVCNQEDFFNDTRVGFHVKLKVAENLGLPSEVSDIAKKLNKIRNKIAHNIYDIHIDKDLLEGLRDSFKNNIIDASSKWKEGDIGVHFYNKDQTEEICVIWNDPNLNNHTLLAVICTLTVVHLVIESAQQRA